MEENFKDISSPPGNTILETIEFMGMSKADFCNRIGLSLDYSDKLFDGRMEITLFWAKQIENVLGIEAEFWLKREELYKKEIGYYEMPDYVEMAEAQKAEEDVREIEHRNEQK